MIESVCFALTPAHSFFLGSLNSGPGCRRFKSSLPDQSSQSDKPCFWFCRHTAVDDFVDGADFLFFQLTFNSIDSRRLERECGKGHNQNIGSKHLI